MHKMNIIHLYVDAFVIFFDENHISILILRWCTDRCRSLALAKHFTASHCTIFMIDQSSVVLIAFYIDFMVVRSFDIDNCRFAVYNVCYDLCSTSTTSLQIRINKFRLSSRNDQRSPRRKNDKHAKLTFRLHFQIVRCRFTEFFTYVKFSYTSCWHPRWPWLYEKLVITFWSKSKSARNETKHINTIISKVNNMKLILWLDANELRRLRWKWFKVFNSFFFVSFFYIFMSYSNIFHLGSTNINIYVVYFNVFIGLFSRKYVRVQLLQSSFENSIPNK